MDGAEKWRRDVVFVKKIRKMLTKSLVKTTPPLTKT